MAVKAKFAHKANNVLAWQLRLLSALQLIAGAGFIAFACVLQWPPGDVLTAGLWVVGSLTVLSAVLGFVAGCSVRCCVPVYATLAVLATLAQTGFLLYLFIAPGQAVEKLSAYQSVQNEGSIKDNLDQIVNIGRWVLLGLLGAQVLAIVLALVMRCCGRRERYLQFEEAEEYERRRTEAESQLDKLKSKVLEDGGAAAAASKKVINISAVSGSAAQRLQQQQQQYARQRSSLFGDDEDRKLEAAESGKIGSARTTSDTVSYPQPATQPPMSAWPAAQQPARDTRSFKPTWSSKANQQ